MRVLIYKRTHNGDPDRFGRFGINDCMGRVRSRRFDAVIGVGGIGAEPKREGIAGKVNWVGIGPHRQPGIRGPIVTFDHFIDFGTEGPDLVAIAPQLAERVYGRNVRSMTHTVVNRHDEVARIVRLAESAPGSSKLSSSISGKKICPPRLKVKTRCANPVC